MWRFLLAAVAGVAAAVVVVALCGSDSGPRPPVSPESVNTPRSDTRDEIGSLIKGLRSPDPAARSIFSRNVVRETGMFFGFKPAALPKERDAAVRRWEEWWSLNRGKTKEQWLIDSLSLKDYEGKTLALKTLVEMNSRACVPAIVSMLDDAGIDLKVDAIRALGKLKGEEAVPALIALLETGEEPRVRHAAARSLGQIGTQEGFVTLERTAKQGDALTRIEAASALMVRAPERALPVLHSLLIESNAEAKQFAISALAAMKKRESVPYLAPLLQAEEPLAAAARRALFAIVGEDLGPEPDAWLQWYERSTKQGG
jgi:hypothetical protein